MSTREGQDTEKNEHQDKSMSSQTSCPQYIQKSFFPPAVGWENPMSVLRKREHVLFDLTEISDVSPWVRSKLSKKAKNLAIKMKAEIKELRGCYSNSERTAKEYKQ